LNKMSMAAINCFLTNTFQNIVCVHQKKKTQGSEQHVAEYIFGWTIPLTRCGPGRCDVQVELRSRFEIPTHYIIGIIFFLVSSKNENVNENKSCYISENLNDG